MSHCGGLHIKREIDGRVVEKRRQAFGALSTDGVETADILRFGGGQGYPDWVIPLSTPEKRKTVDGVELPFTHECYHYLNPEVPAGESRRELRERLVEVWRHSRGFARLGVWIRFTDDPEEFANRLCTVNVLPVGDTTCGSAGTSCVYISTRVVNRIATRKITMNLKLAHMDMGPMVINHEEGHVLKACDMYKFENRTDVTSTYSGVMDAGSDATQWPTRADLSEWRALFRGEARYTQCGYPEG